MIPYYIGGVYETVPKGTIDLCQFIVNIAIPSPEQVAQVDEIQRASKAGNEELKQKLKTKLPFYTPAINCTYRRYVDITNFTGLMPVDFDKLDPHDAISLREELMTYPFVIAAWLSASGRGVRGLVYIPICKNEVEYKSRFKALAEVFSIYDGWDNAPQNAVLPLFYSYDREMITNADFTTFTDIYTYKELPRKQNIKIYSDSDDEDHVINIITKNINKITTTGHFILRSASYAMGGYVGMNYISESKAVEVMDHLICNNPYLSQKPSVYKKTAREMIFKGQEQPLSL